MKFSTGSFLTCVRRLLYGAIGLVFFGSAIVGKIHPQNIVSGVADSIRFAFKEVTGIGYEEGVSRRDPSDIIKVNNIYYIWYTKIPAETNGKRTPLYSSGYYGTIWYATSADGVEWNEQGQALGIGPPGAFDSHAVFTPNILRFDGRYYMYYTAVKPTEGSAARRFENNAYTDITAIGVAVADSPCGPFRRASSEPVIEVSMDSAMFDSYRVDDAALLVRDSKIWLYYKGRSRSHRDSGPRHTQMGVAFSVHPEGPFVKHGQPLLSRSHEVLIWNQDGGIASLASLNRSLYFAHDGLNFSLRQARLLRVPTAPGLYRPHLTDHAVDSLPGWGISHAVRNGHVYLLQFKLP